MDFFALLLANLSPLLIREMFVCLFVGGGGDGGVVVGIFIVFIMQPTRSLSGWLYWEEGFLMWLRSRF